MLSKWALQLSSLSELSKSWLSTLGIRRKSPGSLLVVQLESARHLGINFESTGSPLGFRWESAGSLLGGLLEPAGSSLGTRWESNGYLQGIWLESAGSFLMKLILVLKMVSQNELSKKALQLRVLKSLSNWAPQFAIKSAELMTDHFFVNGVF